MKTLLRNSTLLILVFLCTSISFSQTKQIKKAEKEFDRYAYIDAREIYLKVVDDGYTSAQIYQKLGDTYYWNSDYTNASKWYGKLITEYADDETTTSEYYFRAAQSLKSLKKHDEAERMMEGFKARGGDISRITKFTSDSTYLQKKLSKKYSIEKVAINSEYSDFGPSFYGENKLVYATSSNKTEGSKIHDWNNQPFLDLFVADMDEEGKLSNSVALSTEINTRYHESSATFTKDGKTVYFTRNNFTDGKKGRDKEKTVTLKLYRASIGGDGNWGNVVEVPFNSKEYSVAHPALSPDEKKLYFSSDMPGAKAGAESIKNDERAMSDLWYVDILGDNTYGTPVNLGDINTVSRESFPFISKEWNLYYSTDGLAGLGGYDIFVAKLDSVSGIPGKSVNLGEPANSSQDDFGFIINEEKGLGFLSSNRGGTSGSVDDDIYRILGNCEITIKGTVFDLDSQELLSGAEVTLLDANNKLIDSIIVGLDAAYSFVVECESEYTIRGTKELYNPNEKFVQTPDESGEMIVPLPLRIPDTSKCPPNDLGCRLALQPIYFDFDRYNIREDAAIEIAKVLAAMREYPQLVIHIESHTDSRAPFKYNELLSEKRAQATLNWLVENGIDRSRLSAKGYGEYQLVNQCSDGVECTEEEHQLNRRSMFIIQN